MTAIWSLINWYIIKRIRNIFHSFLQKTFLKMPVHQLIDFISDDARYKRCFISKTGHKLYQVHATINFTCCAFCSHLRKSSCHEYCFSCSKNVYEGCSLILPGIFPFTGSYADIKENSSLPWIFQTPCMGFQRLDGHNYYRNFNDLHLSITVTNYEIIEGIFTGLSNGKRPCHVCAAVNIEICKKCSDMEKNLQNIPCHRILDEISAKYRVMHGIVKHIE